MITQSKLAKCSDTELIALFRSGNELAFNELVKRSKAVMMSAILKIAKDPEDAADLYQDALIKILVLIRDDKYRDEGKFLPFAQRIARNVAIDRFRKVKRQQTASVGDDVRTLERHSAVSDNAEMRIIRKETDAQVRKMIMELPVNQREVLILRHYHDFSFREIAEYTETGINTSLGRMRYAIANLRKMTDRPALSASA